MDIVIEILSWVLMLAGAAMLVIGAIGVVRLPDVFARMHGAGIIDTMGACSVLIGFMFQAGLTIVTVKLALIVVFIVFTSPTSTHALSLAALHGGVQPQISPPEDPDAGKGEPPSKT